jgi:hypothetical protein
VRQRTEPEHLGAQHEDPQPPGKRSMSSGKHGNKEAKKPKKVHVPNPPGLPAGLAPLGGQVVPAKKR